MEKTLDFRLAGVMLVPLIPLSDNNTLPPALKWFATLAVSAGSS